MRVISVIEDKAIIKKILKHLNFWDRKARPPPKMKDSSQEAGIFIDYSARPGATRLPIIGLDYVLF